MARKKCAYCGNGINCKKGEEWKFLCKKCYKEHYLPVKNKYSLYEFKINIEKIKMQEEKRVNDSRLAVSQILREARDEMGY